MLYKINEYNLQIVGAELNEIFFIDFLSYSFKNNLNPSIETLNIMNKIFCFFFNNKFITDINGKNFKLVDINNNFFVPHDIKNKTNLLFSTENYSFEEIDEKFLEYINKFDLIMEDQFPEIEYPDYFKRQKAKNNYVKEIDIFFNYFESSILDDFLKFKPNYKSLLNKYQKNQKIDTIEIIKHEYFEDHYKNINQIIPNILNDLLIKEESKFMFDLIFLNQNYNFNYIHSMHSVKNVENWFTIKKGENFIGGASLSSNYVSSKIDINFIESEKNEKNYKSILKYILKQDNLFNDIILKNIDLNIISNKEIRRINKNKRLYFTNQEEDLFLEVKNFIVSNNLNNKKEEILNDFYEKTILYKQNLVNKEDYSYIKESTIINLKNKYFENSNSENLIEIDRLNFIKLGLSMGSAESFKEFISGGDNPNTYLYFELDNDSINLNLRAGKKIKEFLENINIKINEAQFLNLIFNVKNLGKLNEQHNYYELSLNKIYDYLVDNKILKKFPDKIIYRLEKENGEGIYRTEESIFKQNKFLEYSRRKLPSKEINLNIIFNSDYDNKDLEEYKKNYYFGFSDLKQINNWFLEDIETLLKNDVYLVKYEVPENYVINTKSQTAFIKDKSKFIEKIRYKDLYLKNDNTKLKKPSI